MILDPSTRAEAVLAGAVSANQPEVHVEYRDWNPQGEPTKPALFRVALNSNTDVTILAAPNVGFIREVQRVAIYNKDTASVTVTIKTDDGTTERIVSKTTLLTLETLNFEAGRGWYATDVNGNTKQVTGSLFSSLTDAGLTSGRVTVAGTAGLLGDFSTLTYASSGGLVLNNLLDISGAAGGQISFPASQNASSGANVLDDYEEGSWTPVDSSGAGLTFPGVTGTYVKIGQQINAQFNLSYPATGNVSTCVIGGLPFSSKNSGGEMGGCINYTNQGTAMTLNIDNNATTFRIFTFAGANQTNNGMSSINIRGTLPYRGTA